MSTQMYLNVIDDVKNSKLNSDERISGKSSAQLKISSGKLTDSFQGCNVIIYIIQSYSQVIRITSLA